MLLPLPLLACSTEDASESAEVRVLKEITLLKTHSLGNWKEANFGYEGLVEVKDGIMSLDVGSYLSGVVWKGEPPSRMNYEIELEARKTTGSDFFLGLTVPVGDKHCTWIIGGWGGGLVGISCLDGYDASENDNSSWMNFESKRWYRCKIRVLPERIQCWIDGKVVVDVDIKRHEVSMRPGMIEEAIPLGLAAFETAADYKNIVWRHLALQ